MHSSGCYFFPMSTLQFISRRYSGDTGDDTMVDTGVILPLYPLTLR
jgi:hypothetical protein